MRVDVWVWVIQWSKTKTRVFYELTFKYIHSNVRVAIINLPLNNEMCYEYVLANKFVKSQLFAVLLVEVVKDVLWEGLLLLKAEIAAAVVEVDWEVDAFVEVDWEIVAVVDVDWEVVAFVDVDWEVDAFVEVDWDVDAFLAEMNLEVVAIVL